MSSEQPSSRNDFHVAIICALPTEYNAVALLVDEFWDDKGDRYGRAAGDNNQYTTGRIGKHNVVVALLSHMGKINAAGAATSMRSSYGALKVALLVGISGAVPRGPDGEILLGDVIISKSVVQYDFGRQYPDQFQRKDTVEDNLGKPNKDIRGLLISFETDRVMQLLEERAAEFLRELQAKAATRRRLARDKYKYPGAAQDVLFAPDYRHKHRDSPVCICCSCNNDTDPVCDTALGLGCDSLQCEGQLVPRDRLDEKRQWEQEENIGAQNPAVHLGAVASGDTVMKSAVRRDNIAKQEGVLAFEMEGAGVWEEVPCIVVKGVCDYADSHKHKGWQNFAAATAASVAKAILERYVQTDNVRDTVDAIASPHDKAMETAPNERAEVRDTVRIEFGDHNRGLQNGVNNGTVNFHG